MHRGGREGRTALEINSLLEEYLKLVPRQGRRVSSARKKLSANSISLPPPSPPSYRLPLITEYFRLPSPLIFISILYESRRAPPTLPGRNNKIKTSSRDTKVNETCAIRSTWTNVRLTFYTGKANKTPPAKQLGLPFDTTLCSHPLRARRRSAA